MDSISAVIFDMDGLMIDSEPLWHIAERECFASVGLTLTTEQLLETTGLRIDEVVMHRHSQQPWDRPPLSHKVTLAQMTEKIIDRMKELFRTQLKAKPGLKQVIEFFKSKGLPLAVASSSNMVLIEAALDALDMRKDFLVVHSAEKEEYGKPNPSVYISGS
jgi:sugar-phosphatase